MPTRWQHVDSPNFSIGVDATKIFEPPAGDAQFGRSSSFTSFMFADHTTQRVTPVCTAAADLAEIFKKVMDKLDRIEVLIDAMPSSRGIQCQ